MRRPLHFDALSAIDTVFTGGRLDEYVEERLTDPERTNVVDSTHLAQGTQVSVATESLRPPNRTVTSGR